VWFLYGMYTPFAIKGKSITLIYILVSRNHDSMSIILNLASYQWVLSHRGGSLPPVGEERSLFPQGQEYVVLGESNNYA